MKPHPFTPLSIWTSPRLNKTAVWGRLRQRREIKKEWLSRRFMAEFMQAELKAFTEADEEAKVPARVLVN